MTARAFAEGIEALLTTDAVFVAAVNALIGVPVSNVFVGNVPIANLPVGSLPCWVLEQSDGRAKSLSNDPSDEGLVIGLSEQQFESELLLTLVWAEQDRMRAAQQRMDLPTLMTQLLLRNPMPGGIDFAKFSEWEPDRGVNHPLQVWRASVLGSYAIPRM